MAWSALASKLPEPHMREVSREELGCHNTADSAWVSIQNTVYDVSKYLTYHPGGQAILLEVAGTDATDKFLEYHSFINHQLILGKFAVGHLV
jgi:cytochrome b involved in lipid metabolism